MSVEIEFTTKQEKQVRTEYESGWGMRHLAKAWGVCAPTIRKVIVRAGGEIRGPGRQTV